ncbi:MAG: radical SAM family heme chaperone HemW [Clostridia bacterium]|nr:radical SAM family heme chaperone HemW [Clostridia bacterium]
MANSDLQTAPEAPGLYVHIPFCVKKCRYCDFLSFGVGDCRRRYGPDVIERYFDALFEQLDAVAKGTALRDRLIPREAELPACCDTVYIGGGTPGLADAGLIARLLEKLATVFRIGGGAEVTLEVNPCTVADDKLRAYRAAGVNRLSMGVQSLSERLLNNLGRVHTADVARRAVDAAKKYFDNINLDFIFGIPGIAGSGAGSAPPQSISELRDCLRFVVSERIPHVSFYSLIIEPETEFDRLQTSGALCLPDDADERSMYHELRNFLTENGYIHYEISNFSKPGRESRHNLKYWDGTPYTGLGLGAVSYLPASPNGDYLRFRQTADLSEFLSTGSDPCVKDRGYEIQERLDIDARKREYMMLGFRKLGGPDPERYRRLFNGSMAEDFSKELRLLKERDLIGADNKLTAHGLDYANEIFMMFI